MTDEASVTAPIVPDVPRVESIPAAAEAMPSSSEPKPPRVDTEAAAAAAATTTDTVKPTSDQVINVPCDSSPTLSTDDEAPTKIATMAVSVKVQEASVATEQREVASLEGKNAATAVIASTSDETNGVETDPFTLVTEASSSPPALSASKEVLDETLEQIPLVTAGAEERETLAAYEEEPASVVVYESTSSVTPVVETMTTQATSITDKDKGEDSTSPRTVVVGKETAVETQNSSAGASSTLEPKEDKPTDTTAATETKDETKLEVIPTASTESSSASIAVVEEAPEAKTAIHDVPRSPTKSNLPGAHKPASLIASKQEAILGSQKKDQHSDDVPISPTKRIKLAIPATFLVASPTKEVPKPKIAVISLASPSKPHSNGGATFNIKQTETKSPDASVTDTFVEKEAEVTATSVESATDKLEVKGVDTTGAATGFSPTGKKKLAIPAAFAAPPPSGENTSLAALISPAKRPKKKVAIPAAFAGGGAATGSSEAHKPHAGELAGVPHKKLSAPYTYTEKTTTTGEIPVESPVTPKKKLAIPAVFAENAHVDHPSLTTDKTNPIVSPSSAKKLAIPSAFTGGESKQPELEAEKSPSHVVHKLTIPPLFAEKEKSSPVSPKAYISAAVAGADIAVGAPPLSAVEEATRAAAAAQGSAVSSALDKIINNPNKQEIKSGDVHEMGQVETSIDAGANEVKAADMAKTAAAATSTPRVADTHAEVASASCCTIL